jgi:hypothetical protein
LDDLAQLPPRTIVIYLTIFEDGTGELFVPRDLTADLSAAANAPVYGVYDTYLGRGIVGGYVESFEAIGREAARIGLRILAGDPSESLPLGRVETQSFMVDWRQLRRWGSIKRDCHPAQSCASSSPRFGSSTAGRSSP